MFNDTVIVSDNTAFNASAITVHQVGKFGRRSCRNAMWGTTTDLCFVQEKTQ